MKLSLEFIAEGLKERYSDITLSCKGDSTFDAVRIFNYETYHRSVAKPLVIASPANSTPEELEGCEGVIWIGPQKPPADVPSIWLSSTESALEVFDATLDIMEHYASWYERVRNALLEQSPVKNVVELLGQVTENPFWYGDTALRPLYMAPSERMEILSDVWRHQMEHGRYSAEVLSTLIGSGDLERMNSKRKAWLFEDSATYKGPFVSKTIVCNGNIYGYLFIIQLDQSSVVRDIELLETLGNLVASYIEHSRVATPASSRFADQMLKECLLGSMTSESDMTDLANLLKWDLGDTYAITVFEIDQSHASKDFLKTQMRMLEDNLPGRVILFESSILLISNLTQFPSTDLPASLAQFCSKLSWKAGTSNRFEGFANLKLYYQQAKIALRIGRRINPDELVHSFSECSVFYICEQLSKQVSEPLLIHQDVLRLAQHDGESGGNLLKTLEVYLNNERSVAKTAQELFLHRNSVAYRIDKIRSLMNTDLDDDENRLNIILSLMIWKYLHGDRDSAGSFPRE